MQNVKNALDDLFKTIETTRDEWHNKPDFIILRMLNNLVADLTMKTQTIYDVLNLIVAARPDLFIGDKFNLVERQTRVVSLESKKLWDYVFKLQEALSPKRYTDLTPTTSDSVSTRMSPPQDQRPDSPSEPTQEP